MRQAYDYWQNQPGNCRLGTVAGRGFTSPSTLEPQTFLTASAVLQQPVNRQLCPPVDITTLRKACWSFAQITKPTQTPYSLTGCLSEPPFSQFGSPAFEQKQLWLLQSCFCPGVTTAAQQQALFAPGCPPVVARVVQAGRQQCWERRRNCPTKAADIARAIAVALAVPTPLAPQLSASPTHACPLHHISRKAL